MPVSGPGLRYMVCYDIPEDRRRTRLARCLDDYGSRVQYSVFEMFLDQALFDRMYEQIQGLIDLETDRVHIYPLCATCASKILVLGTTADQPRPGTETILIF